MHIAIEGMDGSGKTSQAKEIAKRTHGEFIAKSFHEMNDTSGIYDSFVTIDKYTSGRIPGVYGMRQNFFIKKFSKDCVVTDRFYVSNYWSRAEELSIDYFKAISDIWGIPDLIIILYANPDVLYERIYQRDSQDKDLLKPKLAENAYQLMFSFVEKMKFQALVIDNSALSFEETTGIILYAKEHGIYQCKERYAGVCRVIAPEKEIIENETGIFEIVNGELAGCRNKTAAVTIPDSVKIIRERAFENCGYLKKIYIPKSVEQISTFAFLDAQAETFEVEEGSAGFCSVNGVIYDKGIRTLIRFPGGADTIEMEDVERIGNCAFQGCTKITEIKFKKALKYIGYGAFIQCENLRRIVFEGSALEMISPGIFYGCPRIQSIELPKPSNYFTEENCLKDAEKNILFYFGTGNQQDTYRVPESVYIYPFAYYARLKAKKVIIGQEKIGAFAFEHCSIGRVVLEDGIRNIGERSFKYAGVEHVEVKETRVLPEIWNNSFDNSACFIVSRNCQDSFIESRDWEKLNVWSAVMEKKAETSCGNACLDYIAAKEKFDGESIPNKPQFWVAELATIIKQCFPCDTLVFYYNSRLMRDYYNPDKPNDDYALQCVQEYVNHDGVIVEEKMSARAIRKYSEKCMWLILCLRSDVLFRDDSLAGNNHYVLLDRMLDKGVYIISPGRENFYRIYLANEVLMDALDGNGQWILGVVMEDV